MAFSSNFFIFAYLPIALLVYFASPASMKNGALLVVSLLFYSFDAGHLAWLLIVSIVLNHVAAKLIARHTGRTRHLIFVATVVANLAFLLHYKYTVFFWQAATPLLSSVGWQIGPAPSIELPIGISFFTFQAISYVADVYMRVTVPARRMVDFGAYHSLFPQLIAGPIVRYVEIEKELHRPRGSFDDVADGLYRFCLGLGKKLILADTMGVVADSVFALPSNELTTGVAWFGAMAYTLQIYFDFSGYSDMAIGLGRMLGFTFPENFDQPYRATSITEFWRRWHMTLSRWFRDYVYIPLGGNRLGPERTYRNLFVVFFMCGLWHGAGYTFVIWGLYHGFWLAAERMYMTHVGPLPGGAIGWLRTFLTVIVGWVVFRATSMDQALAMLKAMAGLSSPTTTVFYDLGTYAVPHHLFFALCGLFFAVCPFDRSAMRLGGTDRTVALKAVSATVIFCYALALLSANSFNPFIYFRF